MARVKGGVVSRKRRKRILKLAKGYYGAKHILFRTAKEQVMNSYYYAYRDRRQKKRDFRKLWITRINAAARMNGLDRKSTRLNSSHANISYAVFCLKKKTTTHHTQPPIYIIDLAPDSCR